jgi:serine/threonine-protein kinase
MNSPLAIGTVVADTYRITAQLGAGGMGSVFAAEHLRLPGKQVAIKVLHTAMAEGEILLRFRREAEIASRIGHPNIVEVLDFNHLPSGEPFLVMELLAGESLAARLRRGRLPERSALDIARQVGSALNAAHRMQVVHRDLKPDNIFLCPRDVDGELRDHVKVLDFGVSKIRNAATVLTQDAALLGTPYYMSPEQASGKNQEIDGRTDIFALGAIVFEMLTGRTAFPGNSVPAVIFQVVFQPHPPLATLLPTVNAKVAAAVDRALAKDPDARFQTMAELVEALTGRPLMSTAGLAAAGAADPGLGLAATAAPSISGVAATAVAPGMAATAVAPAAGLAVTSLAPPPQPYPATVPAQSNRAKRPVLIAAVALTVVASAAAAVYLAPARPAPPPQPRPSISREEPRPLSTVAPAADARPAVAATAPTTVTATVTETAAVTDKHEDRGAGKTPKAKGSAKEETLTPTLLADLEAGERALAANDAAEAIRRARHSLYERKTARASAILTRAFCMQRDLGAAKAELAHVAAADRGRVLRACRAAGLEL